MKRKKILNQDDYFMGMAFMIAAGSNLKQQGAVIVSLDDKITGVGYDAPPNDLKNHSLHAEINAIFNSQTINCGTIFLTHTPCYNCVMAIISAKIKKIVYFNTKELDLNSKDALNSSYVQTVVFSGNLNWMRDYLKSQDIF